MTDEEDYSQAEMRRAIQRIDKSMDELRRVIESGFLAINATLHDSYLTKEKYDADEARRVVVRTSIESTLDDRTAEVNRRLNEQGQLITDLGAEATRRARERRSLWLAIGAIAIPAIVAIVLAFHNTGTHGATCLPMPGSTTQQSCTFH